MTIKILTDLVNDLHAVANKLHLGYTRADEDRVTVNKNDLAELKAGLQAASAHLETLGKDVEAGAEKLEADVEGKPAAGVATAASATGAGTTTAEAGATASGTPAAGAEGNAQGSSSSPTSGSSVTGEGAAGSSPAATGGEAAAVAAGSQQGTASQAGEAS